MFDNYLDNYTDCVCKTIITITIAMIIMIMQILIIMIMNLIMNKEERNPKTLTEIKLVKILK